MLLTALLLLAAPSAKTAKTAGAVSTSATPFVSGDTCTANVPLKLLFKKKPVPIAKGATLTVSAVKGAVASVDASGKSGDIALKELQKKCTKIVVAKSTLPAPKKNAKDEVTLDLGAAPIVKTEKQSEVAVVQAASQPAAANDEQVELTITPGRAATLVYTPILNGGGVGVDAVLPALDRRLPQVLASIQSFATRAGPSVAHALDSESKRCRVDDACLARIGKKLKADGVLAGVLTLKDGLYHLEFRLVDPKTGKTSDRNAQDFANQGLQPLIDHSIDTIRVAVRELIVEEYGRLALKVSESRTQVRIDSRFVGLTPIGPKALSPGDHQLDLQLEDFRPFSQKVTINALEDVTLNVVLEHTPEFVGRYKQHAQLVRHIAWGMVGVAAAGTVATVGLVVAASVINNNEYNKFAGKKLNTDQLKQIADVNHKADVLDGIAIGTGILGGLALGTAIVLFLAGDDPYAYDHPGRPVALRVSFGPGSIALNGSF